MNLSRSRRIDLNYSNKMNELGFGYENGEFVVYRIKGETISKENFLKNLGCRHIIPLGWYSRVDLTKKGVKCQRILVEDLNELAYPEFELCDWNGLMRVIDDPNELIGVHVGEIEERLQKKLYPYSKEFRIAKFEGVNLYWFVDEKNNRYYGFTPKEFELNKWTVFRFAVVAHTTNGPFNVTRINRIKQIY